MAGIRGVNTRPELLIRRSLHAKGFRFRLHDRELAGKPDLVLRSRKAVIFVHGCFWHGHDCSLFKWPSSRAEFWGEKIRTNRARDDRSLATLRADGWRTLVIWECAMKGLGRLPPDKAVADAAEWLCSDSQAGEIRGA